MTGHRFASSGVNPVDLGFRQLDRAIVSSTGSLRQFTNQNMRDRCWRNAELTERLVFSFAPDWSLIIGRSNLRRVAIDVGKPFHRYSRIRKTYLYRGASGDRCSCPGIRIGVVGGRGICGHVHAASIRQSGERFVCACRLQSAGSSLATAIRIKQRPKGDTLGS